MKPIAALLLIVWVSGCTSLSLSGVARPAKNVDVSVGTVLTPQGVRNNGAVRFELF